MHSHYDLAAAEAAIRQTLANAAKRAAGGFVPKVGAKEILVRKAAAKLIVEAA